MDKITDLPKHSYFSFLPPPPLPRTKTTDLTKPDWPTVVNYPILVIKRKQQTLLFYPPGRLMAELPPPPPPPTQKEFRFDFERNNKVKSIQMRYSCVLQSLVKKMNTYICYLSKLTLSLKSAVEVNQVHLNFSLFLSLFSLYWIV